MFHSARLKLTAWYLTIIMVLSAMFSVAIYHVLNREIERFERASRFHIEHRLEPNRRMMTPLPISQELIEETKHRILLMLVLINAGILVTAGGLGYILAGRTLTPIQHMVEEQRRFVGDASHELRTPLTSLKSAFEVYLREKDTTTQEARTLVKESLKEVGKLESLSESLLRLASYLESNGKPVTQPVSLAEVVRLAVRKISPMAKKKQVAIIKTVRDYTARANKESLVDLLVILLDNAVKYSPERSAVNITLKKTDGTAAISVTDHGSGISKKDLLYIFDRFYRADSARTKTSAGGYGLGLAIAKNIVELYKGTIRVTSQVGKGSTFTIQFPLQLAFR